MRLIASAATLPELEQLVNKFFSVISIEYPRTWIYYTPTKVLKYHRVISKGNRYRLKEAKSYARMQKTKYFQTISVRLAK